MNRRCETRCQSPGQSRSRSRGMGAIAAIVVLVLLASIAAAIVRLGATQQSGSAQEVLAARAQQAARAGIEWGLYQAFKGSWTACTAATHTIDLSAEGGMHVTVSCDSALYNEGESAPAVPRTVRLYTIDAAACNATSCPDAARAVTPGYVERRRRVHATQ